MFNISDIKKYHEGSTKEEPTIVQYKILAPTSEKEEMKAILDSCMRRRTRNR